MCPNEADDSLCCFRLQRIFFSAYFLALFSDWVKGAYIYALYSSYGYQQDQIAVLYVSLLHCQRLECCWRQQSYLCHTEPAGASNDPMGLSFLLAISLCHKDSWLPYTERSYYRRPNAIKNQRMTRNDPLGHFVAKTVLVFG